MRILDRLKNAWNVLTRPAVYMDDDELKEWLGITGTNPDVEKEVTYYTCLKMLSETMGKVPLKYYQEKEVIGMTLRKFYLIYNEYLDYNGLRKKDEELNLDTIF